MRRAGVGAAAAALSALLGAGLALGLALHHPLSAALATAAAVGVWALGAALPQAWLAPVLAALPAIGLMPWSGWFTFEELDIALLAGGAGAYGRIAVDRVRGASDAEPVVHGSGVSAIGVLLALAYGGACLVALARGVEQAGGPAWGWWQGVHEPLNALRLVKSFLLALWLMPLLAARSRLGGPSAAPQALAWGLTCGVACVSVLVLWERLAFTSLADFSSDYRITALFWEMHVGGAALDGFLALTLPFALRELLAARSATRWIIVAPVLMVAAYACLATFSRGVYLAVPLGFAVLAVLTALQHRRAGLRGLLTEPRAWAWAAVLCGLFFWAAYHLFPGSGYRGLLGLLGVVALLLPAPAMWRTLDRAGWAVGLVLAVAGSTLALAAAAPLAKGAYIVYALAWCLAAALLVLHRLSPGSTQARWTAIGLLALWPVVVVMLCAVAGTWGGPAARGAALPVAVALGACALAAALWPGTGAWPRALGWQVGSLTAMSVSAVLVGVLLGGAYMGGRMAHAERDLDARLLHWQRAFGWMQGPWDWALGKGAGRYAANHALSGIPEEQTGDHRLRHEGEGIHLALSAGKHMLGFSQMYRVSQRIDAFQGALQLSFEVRAAEDTDVHFEACHKHLLYDDGGCRLREVRVKGAPGRWQSVRVTLPGLGLDHGRWYEHQFIAFSMAVATRGRVVELDRLELVDASGRQLLANGDFERGLARWFYTSDRHHMPWHMKNMPLHLLFEQGWVGLMLAVALVAGACGRLVLGSARDHPLAPTVVAAIVGFVVVGLFDSLLDAPRVALVFHLVTLLAWTLPAVRRPRASAAPLGGNGSRA